MTALPPNQQLVARDRFPVIGERAAGPGPAAWSVTIDGLVRDRRTWTLGDLVALPQTSLTVDIHCVTRWTRLGARFEGVLLADLLAACTPQPLARFASFVARSPRDHSTSLPLADAVGLGTLVAIAYDGAPLPPEHGGPIRTIVPRRYFYKSLKWLQRIDILADDRLGYWEAEFGYHNHADPWLEERYVVANLDKKTVEKVLKARDFTGLDDLRSIEARSLDLTGLKASGVKLRDAHFERAILVDADFSGPQTNLSNAHLEGADLRGATFAGADIEGASFAGADLRGADFTGASLFGVSFTSAEHGGALIDGATRIDEAGIEQLTPEQQAYVRSPRAFGTKDAGPI